MPVREGDRFHIRYADGIENRWARIAAGPWLLPQIWARRGDNSDIEALRVVV